jgi:ABC-type lipoprotein release transport system permease subunit
MDRLEYIIGLRLADELRTLVGDTITVISPEGIERVVSQFGMPILGKIYCEGNFQFSK